MSEEDAEPRERAEPVAASGESAATTQTEQANCAFLKDAQGIPGVIAAKPYGGKTLAEQSIVVFVPTLLSDVSEQVIELQSRLHRVFPDARLEVRIKGVKERGFDPSTITQSDLAQL